MPFPPLLTSFPLYLAYRNPSTFLSTTAFVWQRKRAVSPRKNKRTKRSIIENEKQRKFLFGKNPSHSLLAFPTERKVHRRITSNVCALPFPRRVQQFDFWRSSGFPNKFPTLVEDKSSLNDEWVYVTIKSTCRVTVAKTRKKQVCYRLFGWNVGGEEIGEAFTMNRDRIANCSCRRVCSAASRRILRSCKWLKNETEGERSGVGACVMRWNKNQRWKTPQ